MKSIEVTDYKVTRQCYHCDYTTDTVENWNAHTAAEHPEVWQRWETLKRGTLAPLKAPEKLCTPNPTR